MRQYEQSHLSYHKYKIEEGNISAIIRSFKKFTSKEISKAIQEIPESRREWLLNAMSKEAKRIGRATYYKLWKDDNHAITIDGKIVEIKERLNYIHDNPVRNGLVEEPRIMCTVVQGITKEEKAWCKLNLFKKVNVCPRCKRRLVKEIDEISTKTSTKKFYEE